MVLEYLGLLGQTIDAFDDIRLSPDVMELLFLERDEVRFHQPSLVTAAKEVAALQHAGRIALARNNVHPPKELIAAVGVETASLLYLAEQEHGVVICVLPLHKAGSLTESANVGTLDRLVLSIPDVCAFVYEAGKMDSDDYERTMQILAGTAQRITSKTTRSIDESPVYFTDSALSYLQNANVLRTVVGAISNVLIHTAVAERVNGLIEESDHSKQIQAWIDGIRLRLADALRDGKLSLLPRSPKQNDSHQFGGLGWSSATSLFMNTDTCDVLCVDDRCINRNAHIATTSGKPVPIVCVIDILSHMQSLGIISKREHAAARHRLRRGGFSFIPLDQEELLYWLSSARVVNGTVVETAELRAIRQSTANTTLSGYLTKAEMTTLGTNDANAREATIKQIWQDISVPVDRAAALSDWLWGDLAVAGVYNNSQTPDPSPQDLARSPFIVRLAVLFLPIAIQSDQRRSQFTDWLAHSVLSPLQPANSVVVEHAIDMVCDSIRSLSEGQELYGHWFLAQLPSSTRRETILRHSELAAQSGFTLVSRFQVNNEIDIGGRDLVRAARRVFARGSEETIESTSKKRVSISLDSDTHEIVVQSDGLTETVKTMLPELSVLSPVMATRHETMRGIVARIGATGPGFLYPPCEIVDRALTDDEIASLLSELANGVIARWARLRRLFDQCASVAIEDIVPNDISYYERLCGPRPSHHSPDSYIQDTLIPYRMRLLRNDLRTGLEISLLGALRDDLCPGQWLTDVHDDDVWSALARHRRSNSPFVLIAAIDVALYRQGDSRFREFSEDAIAALSKAMCNKDPAKDYHGLVASLCDFVSSRISLVKGCVGTLGYWKRMCGWMQAAQIVEALAQSSDRIDTRVLGEWADRAVAATGLLAGFVDLRNEPMWPPTRQTREVWSNEIVGRLCLLKKRHEAAGRGIPGWNRVSMDLKEAIGKWQRGALSFPGPLEGHRMPSDRVPDSVTEELEGMWEGKPDYALRALSSICLVFFASETVLEVAREAVRGVPHDPSDSSIERLENASSVAARSRNVALAQAIGVAVIGMARKVESRQHVMRLLFIILTAAAAYEDRDQWGEWLDETLTSVARSLPAEPSDCLCAFHACLDQFGSVVPIDSWFHLRASVVASSGF